MTGRVALVLVGLVGGSLMPAAQAAAADDCLQVPRVGWFMNDGSTPTLTNANATQVLHVRYGGQETPICAGMTATVQKTDGSNRVEVGFDRISGTGHPPTLALEADVPIPLATGAGDWIVTRVARGGESMPVSVRFRIHRGTATTLAQPAAVTAPARTTVTGLVRHYTDTGSLVASPGHTVRITQPDGRTLIATTRSDSAGRFTVAIPFTVNATFRAVASATATYRGSESALVSSHLRATLVRWSAAATTSMNDWWRVDAVAHPQRMWSALEYWNGSAWVSTLSYGPVPASGVFTRWWKPAAAGTFRVRLTLSSTQVDGTPIIRERTVTVINRQTQPTYLSGIAAPTTDTVARPGTKMSAFGHLKVRYTTGKVGPFAGQYVNIQARRLTNPIGAWTNVGGAKTTSSGYFYTNWELYYPEDVEIRAVYTSPHVTIKSTSTNLGVVDVQ